MEQRQLYGCMEGIGGSVGDMVQVNVQMWHRCGAQQRHGTQRGIGSCGAIVERSGGGREVGQYARSRSHVCDACACAVSVAHSPRARTLDGAHSQSAVRDRPGGRDQRSDSRVRGEAADRIQSSELPVK